MKRTNYQKGLYICIITVYEYLTYFKLDLIRASFNGAQGWHLGAFPLQKPPSSLQRPRTLGPDQGHQHLQVSSGRKGTKSDSCFTSSPHIAVRIQRTWEADHGTGCPVLPLQGGASVVDCLIRCYIHPSLDDLVLLNLIFCQLCFISNAQVRNWKHTAGQLARASVTCG